MRLSQWLLVLSIDRLRINFIQQINFHAQLTVYTSFCVCMCERRRIDYLLDRAMADHNSPALLLMIQCR